MAASELTTGSPESRVDVASKRLGWLAIIGIAAMLTVAYAAILIVVEHYWPDSAQFAQAAGHVVITIGVVLIVRKLETPIIEADREALINTIQTKYDSILQNSLPLLASTNAIGLTRVYPTRASAAQAIHEAIEGVETKLLMIGVAFYETFSIEHKCDPIADRIDRRSSETPAKGKAGYEVDARFLLLNPYTTPAVIRSFMESNPHDARRYLEGGGKDFLSSTLYEDWRRAFKSFNNVVYRDRVKFYRRDPGLWMVITDRKVFFEPYTLGRPKNPEGTHKFDRRLGGHMPVFEFERASSPVSKILEEHFERLWAISQDNIESLEPLYSESERAATQLDEHVFGIRKPVLESLVELLEKAEKDPTAV